MANAQVTALTQAVKIVFSENDKEVWEASIGSYAFYWNHNFSKEHDPSLVKGEDNFLCYRPHTKVILRGQKGDAWIDLFRIVAAALTCGTLIEISVDEETLSMLALKPNFLNILSIDHESDVEFADRIAKLHRPRIRMLQTPSHLVNKALAASGSNLHLGPVLINGRLELLNYLREVCISHDYHRYGNLGARENEPRRATT